MAMNNLSFGGNAYDSLSLTNPTVPSMGNLATQNLSLSNPVVPPMGNIAMSGLDLSIPTSTAQPGIPMNMLDWSSPETAGGPFNPSGGGLNFDKGFWLGDKNSMGVLPVGAQLLQTGINAYTGIRGLNLAEEQLAFTKEAFNKNYANQVKMVNSQLRDRQEARYAANPNAYQNPDEYVEENKVG